MINISSQGIEEQRYKTHVLYLSTVAACDEGTEAEVVVVKSHSASTRPFTRHTATRSTKN
jgi:hypothetical protein